MIQRANCRLAGILVGALAGCAVGPEFQAAGGACKAAVLPPRASSPTHTASAPMPGGEAQRFVDGLDIPGQWWTLFQSPELNALIERALKHNPTLEAAQAALRQANENVAAQRGALYPSVAGQYQAQRADGTLRRVRPARESARYLYTLNSASGERVLHARCVRRHSPPGRGAAGAGGIRSAVRARGELPHAHRQRGHRRGHRSLAACADRGHGRHRAVAAARSSTSPSGA